MLCCVDVSLSPGWIATDMAGSRAPGTPEEGAATPIKLATLPVGDTTTGQFWEKEKVSAVV